MNVRNESFTSIFKKVLPDRGGSRDYSFSLCNVKFVSEFIVVSSIHLNFSLDLLPNTDRFKN